MDISQSLSLDGNSLLKTALPDDPLLKGISSYVGEKSPQLTRSRSQDSAFSEPMREELTPLWVEENDNAKAISPFSFSSSVTSNGYGSNGGFPANSQDVNVDNTTEIDPLTGNTNNSSLTNPDSDDSLTTFSLAARSTFSASSLSSSSVSQGKFGDFDGGNDVALEIKDDQGKVIETFSLTGDGYGEVFKDDKYLYVDFEGTDETTTVQISAINNLKLEDFLGSSLKVQTEGSINAGDITLQNTNVSNGNGLVLRSGLGDGQSSNSGSNYRIIDLTPYTDFNIANDINNSSQIVGFTYNYEDYENFDGYVDGNHAFLYSNGQLLDLATTIGDHSVAYKINDSGQIVVSSKTGALLYTDGQITNLGNLPGFRVTVPHGINNSAQVVGFSFSNSYSNERAFLYSDGQMTDLGTLSGFRDSIAYNINDSGQIVGSSYNERYRIGHAFLYSDGQMRDLGTLPGYSYSEAREINNSGQIIGSSYNNSNWRAFLYENERLLDLGALAGGINSFANDINNSGQVVGYSDLGAFVYDDGTMTDLNSLIPSTSGWTLQNATAINDSGQIVGFGDFAGERHAFLLDPINFTATPQDGITVGNISTLGDSIELQGLKITLKGESITTNGGKITLDAPTLLNSPTNEFKFDSTVSADSSGGGDITFKNTFDGYSAGTQNLTLKAGLGNITFDKAVGSSATLKDFTVNGALTFTANGDITSEGDITLKVIDDIRTANLSTNDSSKIDISLGKVGEQIFDSTGNVTTGSITAKELNVLSDGSFTASGMIEALNGDVNITALRDIAIEQISATNGTTRLISGLGSIAATGEIKSDNGLFALARQNITTGQIKASNYTIVLNAKQGAITVNGSLAANNSVALTALKDVVAQQITSQDDVVSVVSASGIVKVQGAISGKDDVAIGAAKDVIAQNITSTFGTVDLGSTQSSIAVSGAISGFDVNISAKQNVTTSRISSWGDAIALISEQGVVTTNGALATNGGEIYLSSAGSLTSQNVISNGGAINVISSQGSIITGYLRSDKEGLSGGKIYLQAAGRIKVISSVLINDTEYSIYTGNNKKGWIEVAYESGVSKSKKSNFAIKDASINGTIAQVSAPPRTLPKPQPIKPGTGTGRGLIWLEIFRRVLDAGGTAPGHMTEINPITGDRYRDEEQFKLIKKFTPNQSDEIIKFINDSRYFLLLDDVEERGDFGTATDEKGRRCFGIPLTVHLGGDANHNDYATDVTGSEGDYILIPPVAITIGNIKRYSIIYDGKVQAGSDATFPSPLFSPSFEPNGIEPIGALAEVKTGHDFLTRVFNGNPLPKRLNANGDEIPSDLERLNELVQQVREEALIARACHRNYFLSFEYSEDVARAAASLINASLASEGISVRVRYIPRF
jgi:probable HAF family extracellular repeat protein